MKIKLREGSRLYDTRVNVNNIRVSLQSYYERLVQSGDLSYYAA